MGLFDWLVGHRKTRSTSGTEKVETKDAIYWYNKGCKILGIEAQPMQHKALVISQGDSFSQSLRQAVLCFNKALKMDPQYTDAFVNKGSALFYLGQYEEAMRCAMKALSLNPNLEPANKLVSLIEETGEIRASRVETESQKPLPNAISVFQKADEYSRRMQEFRERNKIGDRALTNPELIEALGGAEAVSEWNEHLENLLDIVKGQFDI